ncbi:MAG: aromatic ring-hydroxylating dioxygenase subunit alpha [Gammaproteobacteria bacterium]|nr:aromatic ring-hydroxylating dioxygenase subunit alpha [Gammaproteobacteria bacterium]
MQGIETKIFNQPFKVTEGWYWLLPSKSVKRGKAQAVNLMGRELVVYRGQNDIAVVLSAYCPHMGAHLAEGKVESNQIRCFFHNWRFDAKGNCTDIPCLSKLPSKNISLKTWHVVERYQMIWLWVGVSSPTHDIPELPELAGQKMVSALGNRFIKQCHPNVVMVNAIDEQHFHTVHKLPGSILKMEPEMIDQYNIRFSNSGRLQKNTRISRLLSRFYQGPLTYTLSYWYGHLGFVTFGPDFLRLNLMFALRQTREGKTEGQTIVFTRHRKGIMGYLANAFILFLTKLGGRYFAIGDTRVFQTIQFDFKTPITADRAVIFFIKHLEQQRVVNWHGRESKKIESEVV